MSKKEVEVQARTRRVTTSVKLPEAGGSIGSIDLAVVGIATPISFTVDFEELPVALVQQAAIAGFNARFGIAYAGLTDPQEIATVIEAEIANFREGKFVSRSNQPKKVSAPDIVIAWMTAVGKDVSSETEVQVYVANWNSRSDSDKEKITNNWKVIEELDKIHAARRLAKKQKEAVQDDGALEI